MKINKKIYLQGALSLILIIALPFVLDMLNPWPSVKRLGAVVFICGLVFALVLAGFMKSRIDQE